MSLYESGCNIHVREFNQTTRDITFRLHEELECISLVCSFEILFETNSYKDMLMFLQGYRRAILTEPAFDLVALKNYRDNYGNYKTIRSK